MIPEGRYRAKGIEGALGFTSKNSEQVAVLLELTQEGEYKGYQITWYGYFTEKTTERTMESLRYLGWEGDDLNDLRGINANDVTIVVEHEEDDQGEVRARVRWINGGGGLAMKERMDEGAAKAFAARMKGAAVASRNKSKAPVRATQPARATAPNPPRDDNPFPPDSFGGDDIPF